MKNSSHNLSSPYMLGSEPSDPKNLPDVLSNILFYLILLKPRPFPNASLRNLAHNFLSDIPQRRIHNLFTLSNPQSYSTLIQTSSWRRGRKRPLNADTSISPTNHRAQNWFVARRITWSNHVESFRLWYDRAPSLPFPNTRQCTESIISFLRTP